MVKKEQRNRISYKDRYLDDLLNNEITFDEFEAKMKQLKYREQKKQRNSKGGRYIYGQN